jgi:hypothetical protein
VDEDSFSACRPDPAGSQVISIQRGHIRTLVGDPGSSACCELGRDEQQGGETMFHVKQSMKDSTTEIAKTAGKTEIVFLC